MCHRSIYLSGALLCGALCLFPASLRAQKIETLQLCNTGRTAKALPPDACLATELVSPINSEGGGPIVDGNWDIAVPYPYGSYNSAPPDPCIEDFGYLPVPVSAVSSTAWLNPDDGKSQWIEPAGGPSNLPGWYVYVTAFAVPPAFDGSGDYSLNVSGKFLVDDSPDMIYVSSHSAGLSTCGTIGTFSGTSLWAAWTPFQGSATVGGSSIGFLYFVVHNTGPDLNPTGLRVEFTSTYFTPIY